PTVLRRALSREQLVLLQAVEDAGEPWCFLDHPLGHVHGWKRLACSTQDPEHVVLLTGDPEWGKKRREQTRGFVRGTEQCGHCFSGDALLRSPHGSAVHLASGTGMATSRPVRKPSLQLG